MKTKRIVKLSELHQIIGNYLYMHGDANIASIATCTNSDYNNHIKYKFNLTPINGVLALDEEDILTINYHEVSIEEEKTASGIKYVDEPLNGQCCECCGEPVYSTSATTKVCNKCASQYEF